MKTNQSIAKEQAQQQIKQLREDLKKYGKSRHTDKQLLTLILGNEEAAENLIHSVAHDIGQLRRMTMQELATFEGIGEAKASVLAAAFELGRRRAPSPDRPKITCAEDVYKVMQPQLHDLPHEEFWLVLLNRSNHVLSKTQISLGGISGTIADPKIIFNRALAGLASALILVHNHPSGNKQPSQADIQLTKKLKKGGDLLEVPVLDHLIFTDEGYFSFAEEGML